MSRDGGAHRLSAQFIDAGGSRIFVTEFVPVEPATRAVLICPPFAEELNKSRRMLAMLARTLAGQGQRVLIPDLYGTGDSEGEFAHATLDTWLADIRCAVDWLRAQGARSIVLLGLRLGALLALHSAAQRGFPCDRIVLWQPVTSGKTFMRQFLRMSVAAGLQNAQGRSTDAVRAALEQDGSVEVAGYPLSVALVVAIETLSLEPLGEQVPAPIDCLEVVGAADAGISPALERVCRSWQQRAVKATCEAISGDPFWTTAEIATVPALIARTAALVRHP